MTMELNRAGIEAALAHGGGTHNFDDVRESIERGDLHYWPRGDSFVVTEIEVYPRKKVCHIFLAAGKMDDMRALLPGVEQWARVNGCAAVSLLGRLGWGRSFMRDAGFESSFLRMVKEIAL